MSIQNITLTDQNDEWLNQQVANNVFTSKNEGVNYFIKLARKRDEQVELVRVKLIQSEQSGFAKKQSREEMLTEFKKKLKV